MVLVLQPKATKKVTATAELDTYPMPILCESTFFVFLHTSFFEVGIFVFEITGVVDGAVLCAEKISEISELALDVGCR